MREKVTQEAFRQFRSLLQCKPAGHPAQFPVSGRSGPVRCAPIDFNDLRRYTVRIIFTLNAAVCAFQAELVYTIGHSQTNGRCRGDPAAKKINMAVQKAEDMALPKGFAKVIVIFLSIKIGDFTQVI